jgi:Fe2+ or Zn2+ uptake regulation protein
MKAAGLRWTTTRSLVTWALARAERPLNAYAVRDAVAASGRKVDVVSVYRTLATMASLGLVHRIGSADGYWPCALDRAHEGGFQYVYCPTCGLVEEQELDESAVGALSRGLMESGRSVESVNVELVAPCAECASGTDGKGPGD